MRASRCRHTHMNAYMLKGSRGILLKMCGLERYCHVPYFRVPLIIREYSLPLTQFRKKGEFIEARTHPISV